MTRPKNRTPEELAEWKRKRNERELAKRHADPEYAAKVNARNNKYLRKKRATDPSRVEQDRAYSREHNKRPEVKAKNSQRMVAKYHSDQDHAQRVKESHRTRYSTDDQYREARKSYEKRRKYDRRLNEEFDAYLARLAAEEMQHAQQNQ